jgi:hypothetical protein
MKDHEERQRAMVRFSMVWLGGMLVFAYGHAFADDRRAGPT